MATWQWSYPYNAADSATVMFSGTPASPICQWRAPLLDAPQPRQVRMRTGNGAEYVYTVSPAGRLVVLRFNALPEGAATPATALWGYLGMKYFLETIVDFGRLSFGFYDHVGTAEVEMRYAGGIEAFEQIEASLYRGSIRLEKVIG